MTKTLLRNGSSLTIMALLSLYCAKHVSSLSRLRLHPIQSTHALMGGQRGCHRLRINSHHQHHHRLHTCRLHATCAVAVRGDNESDRTLANALSLPTLEYGDSALASFDYILQRDIANKDTDVPADGETGRGRREALVLEKTGSQFKPLKIDFLEGNLAKRVAQNQKELLLQAVKLKGRTADDVLVWDMTGGTGKDAFVMAAAGYHVHMFERSPVVAALVSDALLRMLRTDDVTANQIVARMSLTCGDSTTLHLEESLRIADEAVFVISSPSSLVSPLHVTFPPLDDREENSVDSAGSDGKMSDAAQIADIMDDGQRFSSANEEEQRGGTAAIDDKRRREVRCGSRRPDVVYLDPMFPSKKKSALSGKDMQMLQDLLGEGSVTDKIIAVAEKKSLQQGGEKGGEELSLARDASPERGRAAGVSVGVGRGSGVTLFDKAMELALCKVVVKRPLKGEALSERVQASHAVCGKTNRFDVYIKPPPPRPSVSHASTPLASTSSSSFSAD